MHLRTKFAIQIPVQLGMESAAVPKALGLDWDYSSKPLTGTQSHLAWNERRSHASL